MDFIEYANSWAKSEIIQAKTMIGIGLLFLVALIGILKSETELLCGASIPIGLVVVLLVGYGSLVIYSRTAYVKESIALYQKNKKEAIEKEIVKHTRDNKAGKMLLKVYPSLSLIALIVLLLIPSPYYKGMAIGFVVLFLTTYVMDNGFIIRSDAFLNFLSTHKGNMFN